MGLNDINAPPIDKSNSDKSSLNNIVLPPPLIDESSDDIKPPSIVKHVNEKPRDKASNSNNSVKTDSHSSKSNKQNKPKSDDLSKWLDDNITAEVSGNLADLLFNVLHSVFSSPYRILNPVIKYVICDKAKSKYIILSWVIVALVTLIFIVILSLISSSFNAMPWVISVILDTIVVMIFTGVINLKLNNLKKIYDVKINNKFKVHIDATDDAIDDDELILDDIDDDELTFDDDVDDDELELDVVNEYELTFDDINDDVSTDELVLDGSDCDTPNLIDNLDLVIEDDNTTQGIIDIDSAINNIAAVSKEIFTDRSKVKSQACYAVNEFEELLNSEDNSNDISESELELRAVLDSLMIDSNSGKSISSKDDVRDMLSGNTSESSYRRSRLSRLMPHDDDYEE
mgnify:CR=1 FL=1